MSESDKVLRENLAKVRYANDISKKAKVAARGNYRENGNELNIKGNRTLFTPETIAAVMGEKEGQVTFLEAEGR